MYKYRLNTRHNNLKEEKKIYLLHVQKTISKNDKTETDNIAIYFCFQRTSVFLINISRSSGNFLSILLYL